MEEKDIISVLCTDSNMFKGINRTLRVLISFFTQLVLSEKSGIFRSNKTTTIHAGEGPVRNIKWKGEFLAWANNIVSLAALIYSQLAEASEKHAAHLRCHHTFLTSSWLTPWQAWNYSYNCQRSDCFDSVRTCKFCYYDAMERDLGGPFCDIAVSYLYIPGKSSQVTTAPSYSTFNQFLFTNWMQLYWIAGNYTHLDAGSSQQVCFSLSSTGQIF